MRILVFLSLILVTPFTLNAQSRPIQGEFIESSSPLPGGGKVTTRAEAGQRVQTTVTIASLPDRPKSEANSIAPNTLNASSVLDRGGEANRASQSNRQLADRYPYPASYPPASQVRRGVGANTRVASNSTFQNRAATLQGNGQVAASRVQYPNNCQCAPVAASGLALTPPPNYGLQNNPGFAQNNTQFFAPAAQTPVLSQPPQNPSFQFQPGAVQTQPGAFNGQQFGQVGGPFGVGRSPWLSGSPGAYQPLFRLFNVPQGTFLGQGVLGQPEAYVNGQPVINFFRYILPF